jgi:uncharacterized protein (DUF433 family)
MSLVLSPEAVPMTADADGVLRVGGTRVTLDTLVAGFRQGATAEEIVQQYPTLDLADVFTVFSFYLRHQEAVDDYLHQQRLRAHEVRTESETRWDPTGVRARLLSRRSSGDAR